MAQQRFYEGQTLTLVLETSDSDLSSADTIQIRTKNPNGVEVNNTATITASTKLTCTLASSVIIKGKWSCQAYAEYSGGIIKKGRLVSFEVYESYT